MSKVREKLLKALDELKSEGRKVSPFAVEKRAGVANGSAKYHPTILDLIMAEKAKTTPKPKTASKERNTKKENQQAQKAAEQIEKLKQENASQKAELQACADAIAQLTWEIHRYRTKTNKANVMPFKT